MTDERAISAVEWAANLRNMLDAADDLGTVTWAGPIDDPAQWLRDTARRTRARGGTGAGYAVQTADGEIIVAYTGIGPHAAAYAELIAYLINGACPAIAALAQPAAPAKGLDVKRLRKALWDVADTIEDLTFCGQTAPEAYVQQELAELRKRVVAALAQPEEHR